jgi:hypothetical protein
LEYVVFPPDLERDAFRNGNEFGWTRAQIPLVVDILRSHGMGILGGDVWWIDGTTGSVYLSVLKLAQHEGIAVVYAWNTERRPGEPWSHFVERGASDALNAVERYPNGDIPPDLPGRILYNLTWVSEAEFEELGSKARDL